MIWWLNIVDEINSYKAQNDENPPSNDNIYYSQGP